MRSLLALALLAAIVTLAESQQPMPKQDPNPPRFGQPYRPKEYPQATPKQALESVIAAAGKSDFNYLVAHLLDPGFVDGRLADRAAQFVPTVETDLAKLRDFQQENPDAVTSANRIPTQPAEFRKRISDEAAKRAFTQFVRDVQFKLIDDPEVLKDLRLFNRAGSFPAADDPGTTAKVGHPDIRDRAVYFKKIGERWFIENRQTDEKAPEPKQE
jgi:hypothetical protein